MSLPVASMTKPNLPCIYVSNCVAVVIFALALTRFLKYSSASGIFRDRPAFFIALSNAASEFTNFRPVPPKAALVTNVLPLPGPPAKKKALNIPGS